MTDSPVAIMKSRSVVLFDFDGPLCDVFAGLPAPAVARRLESLTKTTFKTDDPLEVLRLAWQEQLPEANAIEDELVAAEVEAVRVSTAESAGVRLVRALRGEGRSIGIVSNNSGKSVEQFLASQALTDDVATVAGRPYRNPLLMKPNPWSIEQALQSLGVAPQAAVLIGDSITDIQACQAAGVACIALANRLPKRPLFQSTGAVVIESMTELEDAAPDAEEGA